MFGPADIGQDGADPAQPSFRNGFAGEQRIGPAQDRLTIGTEARVGARNLGRADDQGVLSLLPGREQGLEITFTQSGRAEDDGPRLGGAQEPQQHVGR